MSFYIGKSGAKNAPEGANALSLKALKNAGRHGYGFKLYTKKIKDPNIITPEYFRKTFPSPLNNMLKMDYGNLDAKPNLADVKAGKYDSQIVIHHNADHVGPVTGFEVLLDDSCVHLTPF